MTLAEDKVIPGRSQALIPIKNESNHTWTSDNIFFEPFPFAADNGAMARSLHSSSDIISYCNVINSHDEPIMLKKGRSVGIMSEAEIIEQFDDEVLNFTPLDLAHVKNCAPGELFDKDKTPKPPELDLKRIHTGKQLSQAQREKLLEVVLHNHEAFQWDASQLSRTRMVEHSVPTGDHPPIKQRPYPIPSIARDSYIDQVNDMLKINAIRESHSPWCSPTMLVTKRLPDGKIKYRFCINLKGVNKITVKDCYAMPHISSTGECLLGAKYLSTADLDRAFWQVGMKEDYKKKFEFQVDGKLYEPNCMPFGSMNAPSTFQRLMDRVLQGLTWKQCLVYIDDILIFSKTFEEHLRDLDEVFARLRFSGMNLKPSKCRFADNEVEYLGFKITSEGIKPTNKRIDTILNTSPPDTSKQLFSFLASMNFYRGSIPRYGNITSDLYKMANSKKKFCEWNDKTRAIFRLLKEALISAPILVYLDYKKPFIIQGHASSHALASVLLQTIENQLRSVAFASRKLTDTEVRYSATERELLAIVYAYNQFYSHVYGRKITFFTDHQPLVTMNKLKSPHGRLGRLFFKLTGVDYDIKYIEGNKNFLPDFLSRTKNHESVEIKSYLTEVASSIDW